MNSLLLLPLLVVLQVQQACTEDHTQQTTHRAGISYQASTSISTGRVNQWNEHMKSAAKGQGVVEDH
jgi:hypothetical protein